VAGPYPGVVWASWAGRLSDGHEPPCLPMSELRQRTNECEDKLRCEAQRLAQLLLPDLGGPTLEQARAWTGLEYLGPKILEVLETERRALEQQRQVLEQSPEFGQCEHEAARQLQQEKGRLKEHLAALIPFLRTCEGHPRFAELVKKGYGTSAYQGRFWRLSYYSDRSAAAELCRRTGKASWDELMRDYRLATESYSVLGERLQDFDATRRSPKREWEHLGRCLQGLEALHLQTLRVRLQLSLLKGGDIWARLESQSLPPRLKDQVQITALLADQLQELRRMRAER
jgi:hypothetical protein